jgi:hypothetical protein
MCFKAANGQIFYLLLCFSYLWGQMDMPAASTWVVVMPSDTHFSDASACCHSQAQMVMHAVTHMATWSHLQKTHSLDVTSAITK